jgi:hypothetical protein
LHVVAGDKVRVVEVETVVVETVVVTVTEAEAIEAGVATIGAAGAAQAVDSTTDLSTAASFWIFLGATGVI